jgi:hypothetical protein
MRKFMRKFLLPLTVSVLLMAADLSLGFAIYWGVTDREFVEQEWSIQHPFINLPLIIFLLSVSSWALWRQVEQWEAAEKYAAQPVPAEEPSEEAVPAAS